MTRTYFVNTLRVIEKINKSLKKKEKNKDFSEIFHISIMNEFNVNITNIQYSF